MNHDIITVLERIAKALEALAPPALSLPDFHIADAFIWHNANRTFQPVTKINAVKLNLLQGIDPARSTLLENSERFAKGLPANNALLWGVRGMGKSSLIKAVHQDINERHNLHLKLLEVHREDVGSLPDIMSLLKNASFRFILFCDDLSFNHDDTSYKSLKAALEGGLEGRPDNVVFYATSNRRHLLPRDMMDNERSTAINPGEAVEEKISLSDRFGLWIGFHSCNQEDYLKMVFAYTDHFHLKKDKQQLTQDALEWSITRGARSGRTAWQFVQGQI